MRKSKRKLLAMILAGTMVFGMLPSNAFANNEQETTSTVVDETVTTDDSAKLEEEGETNQGATEVEAPVEEALPEGDANTEVAVDLSLEEIKLQKTEEINAGEKYIIVYGNKKALATGKDSIIAEPIEIEGDTVKTEITKNIVWTVDENGSIKTEDNKYLLNDVTLNDNAGTTLKFEAKSVLVEETNTYLTYSEETKEWSFTEVSNEDVTYYNVIGDTSNLEEPVEEPDEPEQGTEGEDTIEDSNEDETAADLEEVVPETLAVNDVYKLYTGDIEPGEYIIVAANTNYALTNNNTNSGGKTEVSINNNEITAANNNYIWTFTKSGNNYTVKNGNTYLRIGSSNLLSSESASMTITNKQNGAYTIKKSDKERYLLYSNSSFTYSNSRDNVVRLYKKVEVPSTLKAEFYIGTTLVKTLSYDNLTTGSTQVITRPDEVQGYTFNNMTINNGTSSTTENLNVNIPNSGENVVKYYYNAKSTANVNVEFYLVNGTTSEVKSFYSQTVNIGDIHSVVKPSEVADHVFTEMKIKEGNSSERTSSYESLNVQINQNTTLKYYYTNQSYQDSINLNKNITEINKVDTVWDRGYSYDVELSVRGSEIIKGKPVDVTLVVDISNSMTNNNSENMKITKAAAKEFVDKVITDSSDRIRVSIVAYGSNAFAYKFGTSINYSSNNYTQYSSSTSISGNGYYSSNKTALNNVIDKLEPGIKNDSGGTNTESGFLAATSVVGTKRPEAESIVIFMSDGVPTYRINGTSNTNDNSGTATSKYEFNEAVDAALNLKATGSSIYTIALFDNVSDNKQIIANHLLSSTAVYKYDDNESDNTKDISSVSDFSNNFKAQGNTPYSTQYYSVSDTTTANAKMKEIYTQLASQAMKIASGTVTDIIPGEFRLSDTEIARLNAIDGISVEEIPDGDGGVDEYGNKKILRTVITYTNVVANKTEVKLEKFSIEPNTNYYGAKYTNQSPNEGETGAEYEYTLFDGVTTGIATVEDPSGFIDPITNPDVYYTTVGTNLAITDVLNNDPSYKNILSDNGYTVEGLNYYLVDINGNKLTSVNLVSTDNSEKKAVVNFSNNGLSFVGDEGTYEFYYVAQANATKGETTKLLTSVPTKVTVYVYGLSNKTYVIDYGKPVTYTGEEVFNGSFEQGATIVLNDGVGKCGTLTMNSSSKDITYTLNRYMDEIEKFNFNVSKSGVAGNLNKTVTIMPATTVYYEDNFGNTSDEDGTNGIVFTGNWKTEGTYVDDKQDSTQGGNYGFDSSYADDSQLSGGSSHVITVGEGEEASASFTFKGTGFDLISRTKNDTGSIIVEISKVNEDKTLTKVKKTIVNNQYQSGDLYQIPVVNFYTEEYATYQVDITVGETVFYLDAIRIYNPLGFENEEANNQYLADKEAFAYIAELRNMILTTGSNQNATVEGNGFVFVDGKEAGTIVDYDNIGPNNEVYLSNGQAIGFTIPSNEDLETIQVGLKSPNGEVTANITGTNVTAETKALNTATDMYYPVTFNKNSTGGYTVVITNNSDNVLAITNLKLTYSKAQQEGTVRIMSDNNTVVVANMLAFESSNNKSVDIDNNGVVDILDLATVASNQNKEVIIGVSTDIYRQDLTGTRTINREDLNIVKDNIQ